MMSDFCFCRLYSFCKLATEVDLFGWPDADVEQSYKVPDHSRVYENILLE